MSGLTPSQTVGPYFRIGLDWPGANLMAGGDTPGERIVLSGRVLDGDGAPVPDAMLEIWQANADGEYAPAAGGFTGSGRCGVDADGTFVFETVKPGAAGDGAGGRQAPHVNVVVFARGLLRHLYTRAYFEEDVQAQQDDPVLARVPADRRATLIARREGDHYRFDVRLQGEGETVFFDV